MAWLGADSLRVLALPPAFIWFCSVREKLSDVAPMPSMPSTALRAAGVEMRRFRLLARLEVENGADMVTGLSWAGCEGSRTIR